MICVPRPKPNKEQSMLQALKQNQERYALAALVTNDGLWEWERNTNKIFYSSRWKSMVGCNPDEIKNSPIEWLVRVHAADIEKLRSNLSCCWQGIISQFEMEYSLLHQDGEYHTMRCKCIAFKDTTGIVKSLTGSQTDITETRQIEAQLGYEAEHDRLTSLPNRQAFIKKLTNLSQLNIGSDYQFGVLCLDIDRFQYINHNFGHRVGDCLLVEIVSRLQSCLRVQDSLARLGGDEFAILLTGFESANYPLEIASKIQQEFASPLNIGEHHILVTASIGIALPPWLNNLLARGVRQSNCHNLIESLQGAEVAMRQAKAQGKACNRVFEPTIYLENQAQFKAQNDLRQALEQEQFALHYQPIIELADNRLVGFEALVRWQHPVDGLVLPGQFIPLAEDTGLIMPIGWWVLRSACAQMLAWNQQYPDSSSLFISVNITSQQLSQPYVCDIVTQILVETGLDPHCLKLEITESEIIENIDVVLATATQLKALGIQLSMDDFGTGYSSLSYLHRLPVDTLKIDRSFIQKLDQNLHQLELVKAIIKLAEVFNLDVIAEGIEGEHQAERLLDLQCKYGQGYLFSRPVSAAIAATWLN